MPGAKLTLGQNNLLTVILGVIWILGINPWLITLLSVSALDFRLTAFISILDGYVILLLIVTLFLKNDHRYRSFLINNGLFLYSILLIFYLLKVLDFSYGKMRNEKDLIFAPHSSVRYTTSEFDYIANINRYGFRGPEPDINHDGSRINVLLLGDSFTYGWGLNFDSTWGAVAETSLRAQGIDVQLLNLGKPGADPMEYADIARRAIPLLKPQIVIINLLQGDDLFQIRRAEAPPPASLPRNGMGKGADFALLQFKKLFPHVSQTILGASLFGSPALAMDVTPDWIKQSGDILNNMTAEEKLRLARMDDQIRAMFQAGQLNPKLIYDALKHPEKYSENENLGDYQCLRSIQFISKQLRQIKNLANEYRGHAIVTMISHPAYVSRDYLQVLKQMGYTVNDTFLFSEASQAALEMATQRADLPFYTSLELFRAAPNDSLYFHFDGHFNMKGAKLYAIFISEVIKKEFQSSVRKRPERQR